MGLVGPTPTPHDPSAVSPSVTSIREQLGDVDESVNHNNEATHSMPFRKKKKLAESSESEPNRDEDNDVIISIS